LKLSHKRCLAIRDAVHKEISELRRQLRKLCTLPEGADTMIAQAGTRAASAAIKAAEEGK